MKPSWLIEDLRAIRHRSAAGELLKGLLGLHGLVWESVQRLATARFFLDLAACPWPHLPKELSTSPLSSMFQPDAGSL